MANLYTREYVCIGDKLIFREGRTKGLGVVKQLGYDKLKDPLSKKVKDAVPSEAADMKANTATTPTSIKTFTTAPTSTTMAAATGTANISDRKTTS